MHTDIKTKIESLIVSGELPHGLLLAGSDVTALLAMAREFAAVLLATDSLDRHPDYVQAEAEVVEDVRRVLAAAVLKSYGRRVFVLQNAQNLTPQAVNNLLKVIEEPKEGTYFFILSTHEEKLLPTLRSRLMSFSVEGGAVQENPAALSFLQAGNVSGRLKAVSGLDAHEHDIGAFLSALYFAETVRLGAESGRRFILLMDCFKHLSANVGASRALSYLAVRW